MKRKNPPEVGAIQIEGNGTEWVVVGSSYSGVSRVRRNSLAHRVHAEISPEIAKSYIEEDEEEKSKDTQ